MQTTPLQAAPGEHGAAVRLATPTDHRDWLVLWHGYQAFYKVAIDDVTTAATWQRLLSDAEPMWCAVAELEGKPVGIVHYLTHRSTWTAGNYCYLQDLFVSKDARGHGLGRALIEAVYKVAQEAGASRVHWLTHETNATARVLYDQLATAPGFIQYRKLF